MARADDLPELSKAELELIRVLWRTERASAREVHDAVAPAFDWAYSTTRTMLDRMVAKGYLVREPFHGVNLYTPAISRPQGLARLVHDFAGRVLQADPGSVVSLFAASSRLTPEEVAELEALVDGLED